MWGERGGWWRGEGETERWLGTASDHCRTDGSSADETQSTRMPNTSHRGMEGGREGGREGERRRRGVGGRRDGT